MDRRTLQKVRVDASRYLAADVVGSGPPVLLDAGGAGQGIGWWADATPVVDLLTEHATVITYDRAGVGCSDPDPRPRTVQHLADDAAALVRGLGLAQPPVVVGWSYGGLVAQLLAALHPEVVRGLVLVDPTPTAREPGLVARTRRNMLLRFVPRISTALLGSPLGSRLASQNAKGEPPSATELRPAEPLSVVLARHRALRDLLANHHRNTVETARALDTFGLPDIPMVVLSAGQRPKESFRSATWIRQDHARLAQRALQGRLKVITDSDHAIPMQRPDAVVHAVTDMLDFQPSNTTCEAPRV